MNCPSCNSSDAYQGLMGWDCLNVACVYFKNGTGTTQSTPILKKSSFNIDDYQGKFYRKQRKNFMARWNLRWKNKLGFLIWTGFWANKQYSNPLEGNTFSDFQEVSVQFWIEDQMDDDLLRAFPEIKKFSSDWGRIKQPLLQALIEHMIDRHGLPRRVTQ